MASIASWFRFAAYWTLAHLFMLCGALDGILTGGYRTISRTKYDRASMITLWKGTGGPAHGIQTAVPKPVLDRVNSHRIRISQESFEEDRPLDPISAVKSDKPANIPIAKRFRALISY